MKRLVFVMVVLALVASVHASHLDRYYFDDHDFSTRSYERFQRERTLDSSHTRDVSSMSDYDLGCATCRSSSRFARREHFEETERFEEVIEHDTYDLFRPRPHYYGRYAAYTGRYPRSRYYYSAHDRFNYDSFGYYRASPHYSWSY